MRILLAGATGAISRPLIRCLKENGHTVFGLARSAQSARAPGLKMPRSIFLELIPFCMRKRPIF